MREARILNQLEQIKLLQWTQVIECSPKGIVREDLWIVWIQGHQGTIWEGGNYPVTITFPQQYPRVGPSIKFETDFRHPHVYQGGQICLPLIEPGHWRTKTNMSDILQRIGSMLHQQINPYSPANVEVFRLFKQNPSEYDKLVRSQAVRYKNKSEKYFSLPSIHISTVNE